MIRDVNQQWDVRAEEDSPGQNEPIEINGVAYFAAFPGDVQKVGRTLWRSDGTEAGTFEVIESTGEQNSFYVGWLVAAGDRMFFTADDGVSGTELWVSDGTVAGTRRIRDAAPGEEGIDPAYLMVVEDRVFFSAELNGDRELWVSDGTESGTLPVTDINPNGSSNPIPLINFNGDLVFSAQTDELGSVLWISDGTVSGTTVLRDLDPIPRTTFSSELEVVDSILFFEARGEDHFELWKTDGTESGTTIVTSIPAQRSRDRRLRDLTNVNGTLYFSAEDDQGFNLWRSDGTESGTVRVSDVTQSGYPINPRELTNVDGVLAFHARDEHGDTELWRSDGSAAGTHRVSNIKVYGSSDPGDLVSTGEILYFTAFDYSGERRMWKSNLSDSGTVPLDRDFRIPAGVTFSAIVAGTDYVYFNAFSQEYGSVLWRTDGSNGGTQPLLDIPSQSLGSAARQYTESGGLVYFGADSVIPDNAVDELWVTDGTEVGTIRLAGDNNEKGWLFPRHLTDVSGQLFFSGHLPQSAHTRELWVTDGTSAGTRMVRDIYPGSGSSRPAWMVNFNGMLYFAANSPQSGIELWKSDGTVDGTTMVRDINPGSSGSDPRELIVAQDRLYFAADDGVHGVELWQSDGTAAGTVRVSSIPGDTTFITQLTAAGDSVWFSASTPESGRELWKSDGTEEGTAMVRDIWTGPLGSSPLHLSAVGEFVYFTAEDGVHGHELWRSDGTADGTRLIRDTYPGRFGGVRWIRPFPHSGHGDQEGAPVLLMSATDPDHGTEIWSSDGTPEGTHRLADLVPGPEPSNPQNVTFLGDTALFFANNALWQTDGTSAGTALVTHPAVAWRSSESAMAVLDDAVVYTGRIQRLQDEPYRISLLPPEFPPAELQLQLAETGFRADWNDLADAARYEILIERVGSAGTPAMRQETPHTSFRINSDGALTAGAYRVWVRGLSLDGRPGPWSQRQNFAVGGVPAILPMPPRSTDRRPVIRWAPVPETFSHEIWISNLDTGTRAVHRTGLDRQQFTPEFDLMPARYAAWVRSQNSQGQPTDWSLPVTFEVLTSPVVIYSGVGVSLTSQPHIKWNTVPDADEYELQIAAEGSSSIIYRRTAIASTLHAVEDGLPAGRYTVWVRAWRNGHPLSEWGYGDSLEVRLPPATIRGDLNGVRWSVVPEAINYDGRVTNVVTGEIVREFAQVSATEYAWETPVKPGRYIVQVRSGYPTGPSSNFSAAAAFEVFADPVVVTEPGDPTVDATPLIRWTAVSDAVNYEIYIGDAAGRRLYSVEDISGTSLRVAPALPSGEHTVWVRAHLTNAGRSRWGSGYRLSIGAAPSVSFASRVLSWNRPQGTTSFEIVLQRQLSDGGGWTTVREDDYYFSSSLSVQSEHAGRYRFWVRALRHESGEVYKSVWSNVRTFQLT